MVYADFIGLVDIVIVGFIIPQNVCCAADASSSCEVQEHKEWQNLGSAGKQLLQILVAENVLGRGSHRS